jgi:hypothetical protein
MFRQTIMMFFETIDKNGNKNNRYSSRSVKWNPIDTFNAMTLRVFLGIITFFLVASACLGGPLVLHEKGEKMPTNLQGPFVVTANGDILCFENGAVHRSSDKGKTWTSKKILDEKRFKDSGERAIIRTKNGTIIAAFLNRNELSYGKNNKGKWGEGDVNDFVLPSYIIRSTDNGETWSEPQQIQRRWCGALRCMIQLKSGRIVLVGQSIASWSHSTLTYASEDEGQTWKASNELVLEVLFPHDHEGAMEATIVQRKDDSVYMLIRTTRGVLYDSVSTDGCMRWSDPKPTEIISSQCCATMTRLSDGRISMLWNTLPPKNPKDFAASREELSIAFSEDDAKTWSKPIVVAARYHKAEDSWVNNQVSYPYLIEVEPGVLWITSMFGGLRMKIHLNDLTK